MELRHHFSENLSSLHQDILRMGTAVEEALQKAIVAFSNHDEALAKEVIAGDARIDKMQGDIEDRGAILIATEQPVASDLREIFTSVKIVSNLERIGDHARHIARAVTEVTDPKLLATIPQFKELADVGVTMVHDCLTAFVQKDAEKALEVAKRDDRIDDIHHNLVHDLLVIVRSSPALVDQGITLLFLARFLERLGDHVTNMCEWIVYAKQGKHVELNP